MVLERYRAGFQHGITPLARAALGLGLTPDAVTALSLVFAVAAGVLFYAASPATPGLLALGAVFAGLNAIADSLDGRMARLGELASRRGDYLDHVVDRYSDVALIVGLALSGFGHPLVGIFALVGTFMTSYMGTQSQALGLGRDYGGFLGRADRVLLIIAVPFLEGLAAMAGYALAPVAGFTAVTALLAYLAIMGNLTAVQRFRSAWRQLGA